MIALIKDHQEEIEALCRRYGVSRLALFGSACSGRFNAERSDLDFVATFEGTRERGYADRYLDFAEALERLFSRPVDVITPGSLQSEFFKKSIEACREVIYDEQVRGHHQATA